MKERHISKRLLYLLKSSLFKERGSGALRPISCLHPFSSKGCPGKVGLIGSWKKLLHLAKSELSSKLLRFCKQTMLSACVHIMASQTSCFESRCISFSSRFKTGSFWFCWNDCMMLILLELQSVSISLAIQNPPDTRSNHQPSGMEAGIHRPSATLSTLKLCMKSCLIVSGLVSFHWRCWLCDFSCFHMMDLHCSLACTYADSEIAWLCRQISINSKWSLIDIHQEVVSTCLGCGSCGGLLAKVPTALLPSRMTWRIDVTVSDSSDFKPSLGRGFKHFLFSPLVGEDSQFDWYFSSGLKPPTRSCHWLFQIQWLCLKQVRLKIVKKMAWDPRMDKYGAIRKASSAAVAWAWFNPLLFSYLRRF